MYARLQRQNSFGPRESKSTLVISRIMELKILEGESSIPNASPIVLESICNSLQSLIDACYSTDPVVCELPKFVKNVTISQCDLSENELIDKRYSEYFEGYSLANNVQYIPVEIECLTNMSEELSKSILALFVSIVFEYISEDHNLRELELIKWGSTFLQRIGNFLGLSELDITSIIKPVSENLELKQLGMNFDDLQLEKQIHIDYIKEQLTPMQESINEFFKQTVGTFSDVDENELNNLNGHKPSDKPNESFSKTYPSLGKEDSNEYAQQYDKNDYKQENTQQDFDLLLNDEDFYGEVDDEEECFKRNFIETYNKDTKYKYESKHKSNIISKTIDTIYNIGEQLDGLTEQNNKYTNLFDEFTEPSYKEDESTNQYGQQSKYAELFDEFTEPTFKVDDEYTNKYTENENNQINTYNVSYKILTEQTNEVNKPDENKFDFNNKNFEFNDSILETNENNYLNKESEYNDNYYKINETNNEQNLNQLIEDTNNLKVIPPYDKSEKSELFSEESDNDSKNQKYQNEDKIDNSKVDLTNLLSNFLTNDSSLNTFNTNEHETSPVVTDLENVDTSGINRLVSNSEIEDNNTNMGDEKESENEKEEDDLLRDLEKSIVHRSSLPADDFDNLLYDMSNMNLPPKKNKSLLSKIGSNISKKINRVFSINSEKSSKMSPSQSINNGPCTYSHRDYLNNLPLVEKSPDIFSVLVRNLVLKYIINGYNDSRGQAIFGHFSNLLGVSCGSLLSIENNMVSDLVGIMDMNAAKTSTKKMSKRLKILSATVGGTALLALTAGVASPVLAVGVVFLGLSGTGVSSYLSSSEGTNILRNMFGLNVSLTQFKAKRDLLSNLQFIQLNPSAVRESVRDGDSSRFPIKEGSKADTPKERDDSNNNYIGICICVGNNIFLNEIFFFENNSSDLRSTETNRHFDSEYIEIWRKQFPVPINDLYLLKWESKLLASLHRMMLKLKSLSIYDKCLELYRTYSSTVYTTHFDNSDEEKEQDDLLSCELRDSSGGNKYTNVEGSSGNYYSGSRDRPISCDGSEVVSGPLTNDTNNHYNGVHKDSKTINWPVGLVQLCSNLDNCWLVCRNRAETCGTLLANAICDKMLTGDRHISLVGYSMGARVIFYCLLTLFERNKINTVKDVVLMGLPSTARHAEWSKCSSVVSGRLINVYNENDWILAFLYRYTSNYKVAGLAPVVHEKVENYNATSLFASHVDYLENISKIVAHLNIQL